MMRPHDADTLAGELVAFTTHSAEGWGFGRIRTGDGLEHAITGTLLAVAPGMHVELAGRWVDSPKYGRQFKVKSFTAATPTSVEGVIAWLEAELPSVGRARAEALVARFGVEQLWHVLEHAPAELATIPGITLARADAMSAAYRAVKADRDHMVQLRGWGLTDGQVGRCLDVWDSPAAVVQAIQKNPYDLIEHVRGFGFQRADEVALRVGVPRDSRVRLVAGIRHVLEDTVASRGHVYVPSGELRVRASNELEVPGADVMDAMRDEIRAGRLILRGMHVYPGRLERAEADAATKVAAMLDLAK